MNDQDKNVFMGPDPEDGDKAFESSAKEEFNTEKILRDDIYDQNKLESYSKYSDYGRERLEEEATSEVFEPREEVLGEDAAHFEGVSEEDKYFENANSYTSQKLDEDDVKKIIADEFRRRRKPMWQKVLTSLFFMALGGGLLFLGLKFLPLKNSGKFVGSGDNKITITPTSDISTEAAVFEKASESVVGVTTKIEEQGNIFFGPQVAEGVGSGVIVSENGYILTNSHVVSDGKAKDIQVVFRNKETAPAKLLWFEPEMDLAVIKIDAENLQPIEVADSDSIRVGDKAIAIGNPLGLDLQSTLTSGYISGLDRSLTMESGVSMDGLIQTDAAINSGNSGGALLNSEGKLIGINTAKAGRAEGLGFAIPINTAKVIVDRISQNGNFEPVMLGIKAVGLDYFKSVTGAEMKVDSGIVVIEVVPNSPAKEAGIEPMDVITAIDGKKITSMGNLRTTLLAYKLGDTVKVEVTRDNLQKEIELHFAGGNL